MLKVFKKKKSSMLKLLAVHCDEKSRVYLPIYLQFINSLAFLTSYCTGIFLGYYAFI